MEGKKQPKFIYFDLGNVLLKFDHRRAADQMSDVSGADSDQVWKLVFDNPLQQKYETGLVSSEEFHQYFCDQTGTLPDRESLLHAASDIFSLNTEIVPVVTQLAAQGFQLGILSNTCDAHWRFVSSGRFRLLTDFFSKIVLSFEVKSMKPEAKIYAEAAKLAGAEPSEIFFTDDRQDNVDGAIAAGFDAVLYSNVDLLVRELTVRNISLNY